MPVDTRFADVGTWGRSVNEIRRLRRVATQMSCSGDTAAFSSAFPLFLGIQAFDAILLFRLDAGEHLGIRILPFTAGRTRHVSHGTRKLLL